MPKAIPFYPTRDDRRVIEEIQRLKPHWTNKNFIIRESLRELLKSLRRASRLDTNLELATQDGQATPATH